MTQISYRVRPEASRVGAIANSDVEYRGRGHQTLLSDECEHRPIAVCLTPKFDVN
ncbi:MAG: hypothetical protein ACP5D7_14930 [Limnospira sp.]